MNYLRVEGFYLMEGKSCIDYTIKMYDFRLVYILKYQNIIIINK